MSFICSSCRWTEFYDDDQGKTYHRGIRRTIQMLYSILVTQLFGVGIKGFDGTLGAFVAGTEARQVSRRLNR